MDGLADCSTYVLHDGAYSDAAETSTVGSEDLDNIIDDDPDDDTDYDGILLTEADIPRAKSSRDKALGSDYLDKITNDDPDDGILLTEADILRVKSSGDKALGSEDLDDDPDGNPDDDAILLTEADIPGASLDGKHPSELNVTELKRWLNCRSAPVSGRKPELIDRVCNYIKYGWDIYLVDPDGGANVQNKLQVAQLNKNPEDVTLLRTIPDIKDSLWTKEIYKAPSVTFGTIYQFLVERKVLIKKANHLESVIDRRDSSDLGVHVQGNVNLSPGTSESVSYTRTLDKAYRFFQDGHVQKV
ncbi:uncharacterized protein [Dysidea avara]